MLRIEDKLLVSEVAKRRELQAEKGNKPIASNNAPTPQPGEMRNFGAIARSAECAGAHGLIVPLKNAAPVNSEAIRSSAGALTAIPVCRVGSIRNTLKALQAEGYQVVGATEKSRKLLYDADFRKPTALVMGAEDTGISKEVLKLCDEQLAIPMIGKIESLNVSAAAAVLLFEIVRQRIG